MHGLHAVDASGLRITPSSAASAGPPASSGGGALGDRLGRRRVFLTGVALFALASMGCGASPTGQVLIVMRGVQGVGAALLVPGSLALISAAYEDKVERGAAIGTWSAFSAIT